MNYKRVNIKGKEGIRIVAKNSNKGYFVYRSTGTNQFGDFNNIRIVKIWGEPPNFSRTHCHSDDCRYSEALSWPVEYNYFIIKALGEI